jgi:hypothetical protein
MKKIRLVLMFAVFVSAVSCDVLEQASEMTRLSKCEYRLHAVDNIRLAGIDIKDMENYEELSFLQIAKLSAAVASNDLPLSFRLDVQGRNPNQGKAAMNSLDWILYIDDIEMTRGILNDRVEIPPNGGVANIPLSISVDLMQALSGKSGNALLNFGFNLAGAGNEPTRILLKAKPTVYVGGKPIEYPGYINIRTEFTSGGANSGPAQEFKL